MATPEEMEPIDAVPKTEVDHMRIEQTVEEVRRAAYWFFGIAALSIVNSFLISKGTYFILGLALSQLVDGVMMEITGEQNLVFGLIPSLLFIVFGYFAAKLQRWAFIVGALVYAGDGVLYFLFEEWLAGGIHIYILYKLYQGYRSLGEYEELEAKRN
jgi:hypothetical protein